MPVAIQKDEDADVTPMEIDELKSSGSCKELDEEDAWILRKWGVGPYVRPIERVEKDIGQAMGRLSTLIGVREADSGLAPMKLWDFEHDRVRMKQEMPLQVASCTKIIDGGTDHARYIINIRDYAKYVVGLGEKVSAMDVEEGCRVGVDTTVGGKYRVMLPLPPRYDASVHAMVVEERPDVTYEDIGGCSEQLERLREVVEWPILNPERFTALGIDPPKGVLLYGPPGTGKTLVAKAVANRTHACYMCVCGSQLVQKYIGEGPRMVRELFKIARSQKTCILFIDEVDAIGGSRGGGAGASEDSEVHRIMLEMVNQLDGFDARGNVKVLMATNRPDTLDPSLIRPGRLDRKVEFCLPDLAGRAHILKIHTQRMALDRNVRLELLSRLCPNTTGADLKSVCTEAGMFAVRARRKMVYEKDFIDAVQKVIKSNSKFSSTPAYMVFN